MVIQPLLQTIGVSERLVKRKSPASKSPKVAECNGARREWAAPRRRQRRATRQGAAPYRLGGAMTLAICHHVFSGGHMHAYCTPSSENSGKGRENQGEGSTRMCFLRLTNMPNAMIMDLRKRFFRMTDALFFHRLLHRRNKSSTDFSQQPTERMVTDAILKSELHAFQRMVEISRERSQWVSQRHRCRREKTVA